MKRYIRSTTYNGFDENAFNEDQLYLIKDGLSRGLDINFYADPAFDFDQMREIKTGLALGLDVSLYADPAFDHDQMIQIRYGLMDGLDVREYADPKFSYDEMYQIRENLYYASNADSVESQDNSEDNEDNELASEIYDMFGSNPVKHYFLASPGWYGYGTYGSDYSIDYWVLEDGRCVATSGYSGSLEFSNHDEMLKNMDKVRNEMVDELDELYNDGAISDDEYNKLMNNYLS